MDNPFASATPEAVISCAGRVFDQKESLSSTLFVEDGQTVEKVGGCVDVSKGGGAKASLESLLMLTLSLGSMAGAFSEAWQS